MVRDAVELVSELFPAGRISRWIPRRIDFANGRPVRAHQVRKTRTARAYGRKTGSRMRVLFADLEREWRGGQSQALLTLCGLAERGHEVELLAARHSPLANRGLGAGITVHQVPRFGLRFWAARAMRSLIAGGRFEVVHLNEPHALTAAWLAGTHQR